MISHILFADNDVSFLNTRSEFLERAGYDVIKATTLTEAEWLLKNANIHLAILDIRMQNDDDERDRSGLELAKQAAYRSVPKIILTNHAYYDAVREALKEQKGFKPAIDIIKKEDGPEALITAIKSAFDESVRINWSLTPDWKAANPLALVSRLEPGVENERERLVDRAEELEDLFRRLFYEKDRIRIDRVLWKQEGRVALTVFAFKDAAMDQFVVVCGQNALVVEEASRWQDFAPKAQGETGTTLADKAETTHFAANAYALAKADLETARSLADVYRAGDRKLFTQAVETLFAETLAAWHPAPPVPAERALEDLYRGRLGLTAERISPQAFRARWQKLVQHIPDLKKIIPDLEPITALLQAVAAERSTLKIKSPGTVAGDSILMDAHGHAWLTDFADAGDVPRFWNFVTLESAIRFDWLDERELMRLQEVEASLLDDSHFGRPDAQGVESAAARQAVRFIQPIRRLAARAVGKEYWQYHLGIFFNAARRLADFDPTLTPTPGEQARLARALMAMALIAAKIGQAEREVVAKGERGLRVDRDGVKRDGKSISVRGQSLDLLKYLADPPNQLRTQRDIIENVLKEQFNARDKTQITRLHAAVRRLREKIEYDPDHPRYLLTESDGYRLVLQPDD
jgi:DNA-binding response OmpR family regulator